LILFHPVFRTPCHDVPVEWIILAALLLGSWALAEAACAAGLRQLQARARVRYAPRDRPALSAACRQFIEQL